MSFAYYYIVVCLPPAYVRRVVREWRNYSVTSTIFRETFWVYRAHLPKKIGINLERAWNMKVLENKKKHARKGKFASKICFRMVRWCNPVSNIDRLGWVLWFFGGAMTSIQMQKWSLSFFLTARVSSFNCTFSQLSSRTFLFFMQEPFF